ncbi:MAG: hypothetical protein EOP85_17655 [Verrucomicrobiaceae bacterium]|nr:MAG: hypothetical protein EOP85_17655 [Verrucomicrobiaceae bacterium]
MEIPPIHAKHDRITTAQAAIDGDAVFIPQLKHSLMPYQVTLCRLPMILSKSHFESGKRDC